MTVIYVQFRRPAPRWYDRLPRGWAFLAVVSAPWMVLFAAWQVGGA